jgi:phage baseplate assembly protein W
MSFSWTLPAYTALPSPVPSDEGTRDLFGYDILFKDGDLPLTRGGDYIRVGGLDNLRAAIYRRLITRPGEFRYRPSYGVGVGMYVKKVRSQAVLDSLRTKIIDQLSQDKRIDAVDVATSTETVGGVSVLRVVVKVTAGGQDKTFEPFTFAEEI